MIVVDIAGERCGLEGPDELEHAARVRYGAFVVQAEPTAQLTISVAANFRGDYAAPVAIGVRVEGSTLVFDGAARGELDLDTGVGRVDDVTDLGALDAALRAIVATRAPLRGTLVLHGLVASTPGGALVLVGKSGAGKSTAARELDAACDELVALDVGAGIASSTPYWGGRPFRASLHALGVLVRGGARVSSVSGTMSIRALAPHIVRYAGYAPAERAIFQLLMNLASRRDVWTVEAPIGDAFPAFVQHAVRTIQEGARA